MYVRHTFVDTVLDEVMLVAADQALIGVYFSHHWYLPPADSIGEPVAADGDEVFEATRVQLDEYLRGDRTEFDLPTSTSGNPFQERVWAMLDQIPLGQTTTYGELAERLGDKALAQLVGQAVGHNPISIVIPCHRVVGKDGKLTGYAGGLKRKQFLLDLEEPELVEDGKAVKVGKLF
jgi:methylated-DNA-[protein]-cysteine S-methyltransferase